MYPLGAVQAETVFDALPKPSPSASRYQVALVPTVMELVRISSSLKLAFEAVKVTL
jgi:hypothetical protein